jgi:hypothetical protein
MRRLRVRPRGGEVQRRQAGAIGREHRSDVRRLVDRLRQDLIEDLLGVGEVPGLDEDRHEFGRDLRSTARLTFEP